MNIQTISQEIKSHHTLLIVIVVSVILLFGFRKWIAHEDGVAHDQKVLADANLKQLQASNAVKDASQAKQDQAFQELSNQVTAANQASQMQIAALRTQLQKQQDQDKVIPVPALGNRLSELTGSKVGEVKPSSDGLDVSESASRAVVSQLEELPIGRQTITTQQSVIARDDQEITACKSDVNGLHEQIGRDAAVLKAANDACAADKKDMKASARKSKWHWFLGGVAAGATVAARLLL